MPLNEVFQFNLSNETFINIWLKSKIYKNETLDLRSDKTVLNDLKITWEFEHHISITFIPHEFHDKIETYQYQTRINYSLV